MSPQSADGRSAGSDGGAARPPRRVVVSSLTGRPIPWDEPETDGRDARSPEPGPILPARVAEDSPEPGSDESNDARIAGDVPPHWGRGR